MIIQKRNDEQTSFNPSKILNRIKKAAKGLKVNSDEIFIKGITSLPNEGVITTKEIDKLLAEIAASYTGSHYDYSKLAANIAISSYHKETNKAEQQIRYKNIQPCSCGWVYFIRGLFLK